MYTSSLGVNFYRFIVLSIFLASLISVEPFLTSAGGLRKVGTKPQVGPPPPARNKYALLVGVSRYNKGGSDDWWNLNTKGDLELLADILIRKFEFKPENIKILCDEEVTVDGKKIPPVKPTHQEIVSAFRTFLIAKAVEGDIIYFHFSGHGEQVPDDDKNGPNPIIGDELDGYDETIIPWDYVSQTDGSKNIRDDEIGQLLGELSQKKPANVTITLDSCFSGTATRGSITRGGAWKGKPVDPGKIRGQDEDAADFVTRGGGGATGEQNYVFLSAASQRQTAKETTEDNREYGAFSYAFAKAIENAGDKTTYRDLFQKVTDVITRTQLEQTPQIEGNQLDKIIMADGALPPQRFVNVRLNAEGIPFFGAGKLQGLTPGSKFNLCAAEAKECLDNEKIVSAEIIDVNPTTSTIKLEGQITPEKLETAKRAFEIFHNYEDLLKVAVKEDTRTRAAGLDTVFTALGLAKKVSATAGWNILVRSSDQTDVKEKKVEAAFQGLVLQRHDGSLIKTIPDGANVATQVKDALLAEANWLTIKGLGDTSDPGLSNFIKLEMIPLEFKNDPVTGESLGRKEIPVEKLYSRDGRIELKVGTYVRLNIINTGTENLYVTILDMRPNGKIGPGFPSANADNKIPADNKPHLANDFKITEPLGQESFRAVVTRTPTDFTPLISPELLSRGVGERGSNALNSPLGKILTNTQQGKRSESVQPPASWATVTLDFFVIPRQ